MSLPSGVICTPEEYERSLQDSSIHCLTRGDSIGLTVICEAGLLSLLALLYVFLRIFRKAIRKRVFHKPMDLLMSSLFVADALQAIGGVQNLKWIYDGKVVAGDYCNSQGIIQNVGETGVALSTLSIAAYTLIGIRWRDIQSMKITLGVLAVIWGFILIVVTIGNTINRDPDKPSFEIPTPYWCWISIEYMSWRIFAEYFWLWFTLIFSLLAYFPLFLWLRGNLVFDDEMWWKCYCIRGEATPEDRARRWKSLFMLAYPMVYCVTVLPLTVARWIGFGQQAKYGRIFAPSAATFFAVTIFGLSGFFNVILLLTTRPDVGLFNKSTSATEESSLRMSPTDQLHQPRVGENLPQGREDIQEGEYPPVFGRLPS